MNDLFNTTFEISLRALLVLETFNGKSESADKIAALDFIASYGADFGIGNKNLHGKNSFRYSELPTRRTLTKQALRNLVLEGLADAKQSNDGFEYSSNIAGSEYCSRLDNDYANEYRMLISSAVDYVGNRTAQSLLNIIQDESVAALQRGVRNG
jgi:hypothetical protein